MQREFLNTHFLTQSPSLHLCERINTIFVARHFGCCMLLVYLFLYING